jgi:hypothetical protein
MNNINGYDIKRIDISDYSNNDNLAIQLINSNKEYGYDEPYAIMSVNLDQTLPSNFAYVDTNNCKWATEFIEKNNLGVDTGKTRQSGWCEYPLYMFDFEKIKEYNERNKR